MRFKIVFWNPSTLKKRVYHFTVTRDHINHAWNIHMVHDVVGFEDDLTIRWDYVDFIKKWAECDRRYNEYVSIKEVA